MKIRELILMVLLGGSLLLLACDGPRVVWSAESKSPDGRFVATARTVETSGIGTGDPGTFVYLNWTAGSQSPTIILSLIPTERDATNVEMNWLTPSHLELAYKGHRTPDFQAIRCHGIDITVRELPVSSR